MALGCTVEELLNRLSSRELSEWLALDRIEPFGYKRDDLRFAMLCCLIANANRSSKTEPFKISDFLLKFGGKKEEEMSDDEIKNTLMTLVVKKDK